MIVEIEKGATHIEMTYSTLDTVVEIYRHMNFDFILEYFTMTLFIIGYEKRKILTNTLRPILTIIENTHVMSFVITRFINTHCVSSAKPCLLKTASVRFVSGLIYLLI